MNEEFFNTTDPEGTQVLGAIQIRRIIQPNGDLDTVWELTHGLRFEEAITALEMTKLKLHHLMMIGQDQ